MPDRHEIERLCVVVALATLAPAVPAQDYPSRPIRLIVTTPPGGLVDLLGRTLALPLGERLGQPVIVENRSGGTTSIGVETVVRAPADGYLLLIGTSEMTMLPVLKKSYPFDPLRDMTPVALVANSWTVFAVNPKVPANTLPELISYAKTHPGAIRYGTNGVGSSLHIVVEMLKVKTGIDLVHVPYKGGAQAAVDAVSGQIEMASLGIASAAPRRSQLRLLAQTGPTRHPLLAEVPTTAEFGMPEVTMNTWFGIMGPANLPPPVASRLERDLEPIAHDPALKEKLFGIGCETSWMPHGVFASYIADEGRKWARIIPAVGIKPED